MFSYKVVLDLVIEVALISIIYFLLDHFFTALGENNIMFLAAFFGIALYKGVMLPFILKVTNL